MTSHIFLTKQHTCRAADTQCQQSRQSGRIQATVAKCAASPLPEESWPQLSALQDFFFSVC